VSTGSCAAADDPDAGSPDAGPPDADDPDAGSPDASPPDADVPDADDPDAGPPDADVPDAGAGGGSVIGLDGAGAGAAGSAGACRGPGIELRRADSSSTTTRVTGPVRGHLRFRWHSAKGSRPPLVALRRHRVGHFPPGPTFGPPSDPGGRPP
jgi:hypothetical protein